MFLELHRDLIRSGLKKYSALPKILKKYQWMESYHQAVLAEHFGSHIPQHLRV